MGISDISGLVSGGGEPPKLASDSEETDLHVGVMEWLEGIDEMDRKGTDEGSTLTQFSPYRHLVRNPSLPYTQPLLDMAITNWLRHVTHDGKPSQTIVIGHIALGQVSFSVTPLDIRRCLITAGQLLNGKPVNSLTIPACYPRIAQLFNNDPECSVGGRFSIFTALPVNNGTRGFS
ncbi:hypothetical protein PM082_013744 [Marasmius tenuissimus]|nr:hypothetical protein PM082_013744 [Marasmius tenuissimus]